MGVGTGWGQAHSLLALKVHAGPQGLSCGGLLVLPLQGTLLRMGWRPQGHGPSSLSSRVLMMDYVLELGEGRVDGKGVTLGRGKEAPSPAAPGQ